MAAAAAALASTLNNADAYGGPRLRPFLRLSGTVMVSALILMWYPLLATVALMRFFIPGSKQFLTKVRGNRFAVEHNLAM